jgi:hypothetical protein
MVDYYGLPKTGARCWPGRDAAAAALFGQKATIVEEALLADVRKELPDDFDPTRFLPYVMMHEFEGMLFSDCGRFASSIGEPNLSAQMSAIRARFSSPEEINDSPHTAPSKRIEALVPGYQKPLHGNIAAIEIGLESIRAQCPHFSQWLTKLEDWLRLPRAT